MTCQDHSFNVLGENPKFFKMIVQDTIQEGRLAIPKKFVNQYGACLSGRVVIKVADGTVWKMELSKSEKYDAWLENGWKEFLKHYSLRHGSLLLFKYEHNSSFLVFIFGSTHLEIQYPRKPNVEKGKSTVFKDRRISHPLEAADKFTSVNPSFKVVLKSYRGMLPFVSIPTAFIREHMGLNLQNIILKIEGSACCWPIKLNVYWKKRVANLGAGWSSFVSDIRLKDNDVCLFELVGRNEFKVHFFTA